MDNIFFAILLRPCMEFRQLRHFLALAEETHFGRAADRLCISQPALSASMLRLEDDLGVRLFERDSKSVRITRAGEMMLGCAREMVNNADRAKSFARALSDGSHGRLDVGFSGLVLRRDLDQVLLDCRKDYPDIEIVMHEISSQKQTELLRAGRLDAGFVSFPLAPEGLEHVELHEDRFVACVPADHPLARNKSIDITLLRDEPFIVTAREFAPSIYDQLLGLCALAGFHPRVAFETNHSTSIVALVARGHGVGLALESAANIGIKGAVFVPLESRQPRRCGYFIWNATREAPGLQSLVELIRTYAEHRTARVVPLRRRRSM
jgi:DNA-binding transcriptional LysR family regulator